MACAEQMKQLRVEVDVLIAHRYAHPTHWRGAEGLRDLSVIATAPAAFGDQDAQCRNEGAGDDPHEAVLRGIGRQACATGAHNARIETIENRRQKPRRACPKPASPWPRPDARYELERVMRDFVASRQHPAVLDHHRDLTGVARATLAPIIMGRADRFGLFHAAGCVGAGEPPATARRTPPTPWCLMSRGRPSGPSQRLDAIQQMEGAGQQRFTCRPCVDLEIRGAADRCWARTRAATMMEIGTSSTTRWLTEAVCCPGGQGA